MGASHDRLRGGTNYQKMLRVDNSNRERTRWIERTVARGQVDNARRRRQRGQSPEAVKELGLLSVN